MREYLNLLEEVLLEGERRENRTGIDTIGKFGAQMRFNLEHKFPLITTKKVFWKGVVEELLWMISGETSVKPLQEKGVRIWDEWADENGNLGPVYGAQWRDFGGVDQLKEVVERIKTNPKCRRLIVSAWNPAEIESMALPPCHMFYQFYVSNDGLLSCHMYQRSADMFLGVPFNIASYALLTHLVAHHTGLKPGELVHTFGDVHIYVNHQEQVLEQLRREPKPLPTLNLNVRKKDIFEMTAEDINLVGYYPHPAIKGEVAV